ncbi:MAG TPA: M23 family metallopeptidase [Longimicrobium sp.]|nr:M23 family metallopeptidase [Longimicrobium sp.]
MRRISLLLCCAALTACADTPPTASDRTSAGRAPVATKTIRDEVVGVSIDVPAGWEVQGDPVLFNTYGFALFDPDGPKLGGHARSPVARIALAYEAAPGDIEGLVGELMRKYAEFPLVRSEVEVGGTRGVAVSGLPGTDPYTLVYAAHRGRVYRVGVWTAERGLDERATELLASLRFETPARPVSALKLVPVERAMRTLPADGEMQANARANAERVALTAAEGGEPAPGPERAAAHAAVTAQACEFGQPAGLFWQTVWDYTNRFYSGYTTTYSGTYYNMRPGDPGWSAMSGNYGSWWGQGYHVRKCDPYLLNQFYANDWPAHRNANVYSALKGTVEWAGWDYYDAEGFYTLGNYVVVRNGSYRAIMAHLTSIAPGITWGASVGMNTVIGYAGKTGGPWDEHVHSRVAYGESLTYNGQPYGGNTVWPTRLRCVSCRANDPGDIYGNGDGQFVFKDSTGAKFYTRFYHGRWMRG